MIARLKQLMPWFIFFLGSAFVLYKYTLEVSPSIMAPELMQAFHLSGTELGNLAACYFYAYLFMQIPVGILMDRFDARVLMIIAITMCAFATVILASTHSLALAYGSRILVGFFGAFSAVGTMKLVSMLFPAHRFALLSGLMMTAAMLGAVLGQGPLSFMVASAGWRYTLSILAISGFVLAIIFCAFSRVHTPSESQHPDDYNGILAGLKTIAKNPYSWLIAIYSGLAFAPINAFAGLWGIPFLTEMYHVPRTEMASIVSLSFIGFAIGSPLAGWYSNRLGRRKPLMILGTIIAFFCLLICMYVQMPIVLLAILQFVMGFFISFFFISFATIVELNPAKYSGTSIGFINMFNALAGAISEPLVGQFLDLHWKGKMVDGARYFSMSDYQHALIILPIGMIVAIVIVICSKETYCQAENCDSN